MSPLPNMLSARSAWTLAFLAVSLVSATTDTAVEPFCAPSPPIAGFDAPWPGPQGIQQLNQGVSSANWSTAIVGPSSQLVGNSTYGSRAVAMDASNMIYAFDSQQGIIIIPASGVPVTFLALGSGGATSNFLVDGRYLYTVSAVSSGVSLLYVYNLLTTRIAWVSGAFPGNAPVIRSLGRGLVAFASEQTTDIYIFDGKTLTLGAKCTLPPGFTLNNSLITNNDVYLFASAYNPTNVSGTGPQLVILAFQMASGGLAWIVPSPLAYPAGFIPFNYMTATSAVLLASAWGSLGGEGTLVLQAASGRMAQDVLGSPSGVSLGLSASCDLVSVRFPLQRPSQLPLFQLITTSTTTGAMTWNAGASYNASWIQSLTCPPPCPGQAFAPLPGTTAVITDARGYLITAFTSVAGASGQRLAGRANPASQVMVQIFDPTLPFVAPPVFSTVLYVAHQGPLTLSLMLGNAGTFVLSAVGLDGGSIYQFSALPWQD